MGDPTRLDGLDYAVCGTLVVLSTMVDIYHSIKARRLTDVSTFLISSSDMGLFPVIFSTIATQLSAIGILGIPAEVYKHGLGYILTVLGMTAIIPFGNHLYLPVFHGLKTKSIYQGGIKAIIWTDVCQLLVMVTTIVLVLVKSSIDLGGIGAVWQQNIVGGRASMITQTGYYTPWTTIFAGCISFMSVLITNQMAVQRYMSKGDLKAAQVSFSGSCLGYALCVILNSLTGIFLYAKYHDCDPLIRGQVSTRDQMMALFSMETLSFLTGFRGVFIAAMLCATLSTLSSLLNSIVVVTLEDIVRPLKLKLKESHLMRLSKILALFYGIVSTGLVAVAENIPGVIPAIFSFYGVLMGPLFGIFTAGMLLPWVNTWVSYPVISVVILLSFQLRVHPQLLFPIVRKAIIKLPKRWRKLLGFSADKNQHMRTWSCNEVGPGATS